MKSVIQYAVYTILCFMMFHVLAVPHIVEYRAKHLNIMQYNADKDRMVGKDSVNFNGWDLHYLQYGTMKNY